MNEGSITTKQRGSYLSKIYVTGEALDKKSFCFIKKNEYHMLHHKSKCVRKNKMLSFNAFH